MQEMQILSLGREDPLESEMATRFSILPWKNSTYREAWWATVTELQSHIQLSIEEKNYKRWDGPRTGRLLGLP